MCGFAPSGLSYSYMNPGAAAQVRSVCIAMTGCGAVWSHVGMRLRLRGLIKASGNWEALHEALVFRS